MSQRYYATTTGQGQRTRRCDALHAITPVYKRFIINFFVCTSEDFPERPFPFAYVSSVLYMGCMIAQKYRCFHNVLCLYLTTTDTAKPIPIRLQITQNHRQNVRYVGSPSINVKKDIYVHRYIGRYTHNNHFFSFSFYVEAFCCFCCSDSAIHLLLFNHFCINE